MINIFEKINNHVINQPDKIAVTCRNTNISYYNLSQYILNISNMLKEYSVGKEDIVGIYMERSPMSVCAVLGILHTGAAFLPIDTKNPKEWVEYTLHKAKVKVVLTLSDDVTFKKFQGIRINISDCVVQAKGAVTHGLRTENDPASLAYVIFTSGSTGLPKGVLIEHAGMNHHLSAKIKLLNLSGSSCVAHNASIGFDISVWQILVPLCVGGTVAVFLEDEIRNLRMFTKVVLEKDITVLEVVPTYLNYLIQYSKKEQIIFPKLNYIISTGEQLRAEVVNKWFESFDISIVNAYGPTEASDDILHSVIKKSDNMDQVPIGKPIDDILLYVTNEDGNTCRKGEKGELWVSGVCVGRGYIDDDDETKKHFSIDPSTGYRMYKTGDLVAENDNGEYMYYGRIDTQVKIHGHRIETKQIENVILSFEGIEDAVVLYSDQILIAIYVSEGEIDIKKLKERLENLLPSYMVPNKFIQRKDLKYTLNGKIDYKQLQSEEVVWKNSEHDQEDGSEETIESKLIKIIEDITAEELTSRIEDWKEDIRRIGLDSATAIDMVVKIEREFDCELEEECLKPDFLFNFYAIKNYLYALSSV